MFTYLKLKNFLSFKDIDFDFKNPDGTPNKIVVLYGENGSGKSNFIQAFDFLKDTINLHYNSNIISRIIFKDIKKDDFDISKSDEYLKLFSLQIPVSNIRSIGSTEDIEVEYGFNINGLNGYYRIVFDEKVKSEELYYLISENRGFHFKLDRENIILSNMIFHDSKYKNYLTDKIFKYWGNQTFLSIIYNEIKTSNYNYVAERLNSNIIEVLDFFQHFNLRFSSIGNDIERNSFNYSKLFKNEFKDGERADKKTLAINKSLLRYLFTNLYSDVKDVYYKTEYDSKGDIISYELYFKKLIGGKIRDISFSNESTGTKNIGYLFFPLLETVMGKTSLIDEADTGIHDVLFNEIILSVAETIKGQLIMTTHNTTLLEMLPKEHVYFIVIDRNGNKEILNVRDYYERTKKNHNIRDRYLKGVYSAIPITGYFDFEDMIYIAQESGDEYE